MEPWVCIRAQMTWVFDLKEKQDHFSWNSIQEFNFRTYLLNKDSRNSTSLQSTHTHTWKAKQTIWKTKEEEIKETYQEIYEELQCANQQSSSLKVVAFILFVAWALS
jgi:vacuolar-type H+-ATPase subunit I/STV1